MGDWWYTPISDDGWSSLSVVLGMDDHLCLRIFKDTLCIVHVKCSLCSINHSGEPSDKGNLSCFLWEGRLVHSCFSPLLVIYRCVKRFLVTDLGRFRLLCSRNCCWLLISNFYHLIEIKISDLKECMTSILYHIYCDKILQMLDLCRLYNVYLYFSDGASCASLERVMVFLCRWWPMII